MIWTKVSVWSEAGALTHSIFKNFLTQWLRVKWILLLILVVADHDKQYTGAIMHQYIVYRLLFECNSGIFQWWWTKMGWYSKKSTQNQQFSSVWGGTVVLPCSPHKHWHHSGIQRTCPGRRSRACRLWEGVAGTAGWGQAPQNWCSVFQWLQGMQIRVRGWRSYIHWIHLIHRASQICTAFFP